jgi:hypothetical protein
VELPSGAAQGRATCATEKATPPTSALTLVCKDVVLIIDQARQGPLSYQIIGAAHCRINGVSNQPAAKAHRSIRSTTSNAAGWE